jgi:hypothetical protein
MLEISLVVEEELLELKKQRVQEQEEQAQVLRGVV